MLFVLNNLPLKKDEPYQNMLGFNMGDPIMHECSDVHLFISQHTVFLRSVDSVAFLIMYFQHVVVAFCSFNNTYDNSSSFKILS